jgi:hypothetical protein
MLRTVYGSLPRQSDGMLSGLPGSFAACGTRHVYTTHSTKSFCVEFWLTLDKLAMHSILSALRVKAWHPTASGLLRVCLEGLLHSYICRKNATTCTSRKELATGSANLTVKIYDYCGI